MRRTFYLMNAGRMSRKDNTLLFQPTTESGEKNGTPRHLPVEGVSDFYVMGSLDVNSAALNFLGQQDISLHFFDYHDNYTGSFVPRESLLAGAVKLAQARAVLSPEKRMEIAREFVRGSLLNLLRNLRYYRNRGKELTAIMESVEANAGPIEEAPDIPTLMGLEGLTRQQYYSAFDTILDGRLIFGSRTKRPPQNELNALISLGNSLCYVECLKALHKTQLDPTLSFLHEPGHRRFSLALDLAEIFKPLLVDRLIFMLVNKEQIGPRDFESGYGGVLLKRGARETLARAWEERLKTTISHPKLGKQVTYRYLIRLEGYKLIKSIMGVEPYRAFRLNW